MKKGNSNLWNILLIVGLFVIVMVVVCSDPNIGTAWEALKNMHWGWAGAAVFFYLGFVAMDGLSVWAFLRKQGYDVPLGYNMFVAMEGQFYSNITPGASGGQPMQVYYLHKKGVPVALASSAQVVRFFCFQLMLSVLGGIFWATHAEFVAEHLGGNLWILIVGFTYNTAMITMLLLFTTNRKLVNWLVTAFAKLAARFKFVKDPDALLSSANKAVDSFHDSLVDLLRSPKDFALQIGIGGLQLMSLMTIIWCIYNGLNCRGATYGQLITLDLAEYLSAAYLPMPGASGASEGVFSLYFSHVMPEGISLAAMLLWRFFTYYGAMVLGLIVTVGYAMRNNKGKKPGEAMKALRTEQEEAAHEE